MSEKEYHGNLKAVPILLLKKISYAVDYDETDGCIKIIPFVSSSVSILY